MLSKEEEEQKTNAPRVLEIPHHFEESLVHLRLSGLEPRLHCSHVCQRILRGLGRPAIRSRCRCYAHSDCPDRRGVLFSQHGGSGWMPVFREDEERFPNFRVEPKSASLPFGRSRRLGSLDSQPIRFDHNQPWVARRRMKHP